MEFNHVAVIGCCITPIDSISIRFHDTVEVALDCVNCMRRTRTILFNRIGASGACTPERNCDGFHGRLVSVDRFSNSGKACVQYQIQHRYVPFVDHEDGRESDSDSVWARVAFDITCERCGVTISRSIENGPKPSHPVYCTCGSHLYDDLEEMPLLRSHTGDPA